MDKVTICASVIVCTYNRAESLTHTLHCLAAQEVQEGDDWEVIVVDNNSKDGTRQTVMEAAATWPRLRYEFEGQQGLSHARNRGIEVAQGRVLLFTDDDVCPEPDWVQRVLDGMRNYGCDACGGYIAPVWEVPPPAWLTERFYGFLAVRTSVRETFRITEQKDAPFGANMAFRREVFERVGLFDTTRGRKGAVLASGEDGELFERILKAGMKVMFLTEARVHHRVEAFRVTKAYFRRWRFQTSRNIAESKGMPGDRRLFGIPFYVYPQFLRSIANAARAKLTGPADEAFNREMIVCHFLGLMRGLISAGRKNGMSATKKAP